MRLSLHLLMIASLLLLGGCAILEDSVFEPYSEERCDRIDDVEKVNGVLVYSEMWPSRNVLYDTGGPFGLAIYFNVNHDKSKVVAIKRLEVTTGKEVLFDRDFSSLRSRYFDRDAPGVQRNGRMIEGVRVGADSSLSFNFSKLFKIEHRPGKTFTVRVIVEVDNGRSSETRELVFRHKGKTKRGIWKWYPPT